MKNIISNVVNSLVLIVCIANPVLAKKINEPLASLPKTNNTICFAENKGQVHDQNYKLRPDVLFSGTDGELIFHLKNKGISYQLCKSNLQKENINRLTKIHSEEGETKLKPLIKESEFNETKNNITIYRLDINWLNSNTNASIIKGNALEGYNNYYLENCSNGALNVKSYENVTYQNIYDGIDLKWYQKDGHLKYDYLISAGADYKNIQLEFKGAEKIRLNNKGELILQTPLGNIIEQAPLVIQNGKELKSKWIIKNNIVSFEIDNIKTNHPFVIDPAVRVWGTYYGGAANDYGRSCVADGSNNVYLAGYTDSNTGTVIATTGAHQSICGGNNDAFLVKFNSAGVRQWATYFGGSGDDRGYSCATFTNGDIYLTGETNSATSNVIATVGSHQSSYGGFLDAFLAKFNSAGVRQWGTYYGGTAPDNGNSCKTDATGNVYLAGYTDSNTGTIIATAGAHQSAIGGNYDAFLVKFNSVGVRQWGTYYGGNLYENGFSCSTDAVGNVYLSGDSESNTGTAIATSTAHQFGFGGGSNDAFLAKFDGLGARQWGTYYGGIGSDYGQSCVTDANGNVYLAGFTDSNNGTLIATAGAHQTTLGGNYDAFLVKFNSVGSRQWGTYYGGIGSDYGNSCTTDASGNVYFTGHSASNTGTVIATAGSHQSIHGGGNSDAFLSKFNPSGFRDWGTYYGSSAVGFEIGSSCASDATGNVYLAGYVPSSTGTIIATIGSHQSIFGGSSSDAFLVKFNDCNIPSSPTNNTPLANQSICSNSTATLMAIGTGTISWFANSTGGSSVGTGTAIVTPTLSPATYTYYAETESCAVSATRTPITLTVNPNPTISVNSGSICSGESFTITPSGANTYSFQGGNAVVNPTANTTYTVVGTSSSGCLSQAFATSSIIVNPNPTITVNSGSICIGNSFTITPTGANTYSFQGGNAVVNPTANTIYTVVGVSSIGCISQIVNSNITVNPLPTVSIASSTSLVCIGNTASLTASGATNYNWNPPASGSVIAISPTITSSYTVTGNAANGCSNTAVITQSVDVCTMLSQLPFSNSEIQVYPNPNNGIFYLNALSPSQIIITNIIGQELLKQNYGLGFNRIDLSNLVNGVYFINAIFDNNRQTLKIIKE